MNEMSYLYASRKESYNGGTFVRYLIEEGVILPRNLYIIGVSDKPPLISDFTNNSVKHLVKCYNEFIEKGITIIDKSSIQKNGICASILPSLKRIDAQNIYISVDIDVGANNALYGAREMMGIKGLSELQIYGIALLIREFIERKNINLIGIDIMETDAYTAGKILPNGTIDRTYNIEENLIRILLGFSSLRLSTSTSKAIEHIINERILPPELVNDEKLILEELESLIELGVLTVKDGKMWVSPMARSFLKVLMGNSGYL
jgi:hypothetical protein